MTAEEWFASDDLGAMLGSLRGQGTDRKLRLFAAACCRLVWARLPFAECRPAVELGERYADGFATLAELEDARRALHRRLAQVRGSRARLAQAAARLLQPRFAHATAAAVAATAWTGRVQHLVPAMHRAILRDLVATPAGRLRMTPVRDPGVLELAQAIYDERGFDRLPALAAALEGAGDANANLLAHCRAPGLHVRGCWALDALLGRD